MSWRFFLIVLAVCLGPVAGWAEEAPRQVIKTFSDQLLGLMKEGKQLGFDGRADKIKPAVLAAYDMPVMTRNALGPSGEKLSPDEWNQLTEAFTRYTVANYAEEFDDWSGESFDVGQPRQSSGDNVVVPSHIVPKTGTPTEIDYLMHRTADGQWRIIDVLLDGTVSQLAVRRSEFVSIFRRDGLPGLVDVLGRKTAALGPK